MIVSASQALPKCHYCAATPVIERIVAQDKFSWFVMCKSEACAKRPDNGQMTVGRPLTNGEDSQHKVEARWLEFSGSETYRTQLDKVGR